MVEKNKKYSKVSFIIHMIIDIILFIGFLFTSLISPYKYEWDNNLKQIDSDAIEVLFVLWSIIVLVTIILSTIQIHYFKKTKLRRFYILIFLDYTILIFSIIKLSFIIVLMF